MDGFSFRGEFGDACFDLLADLPGDCSAVDDLGHGGDYTEGAAQVPRDRTDMSAGAMLSPAAKRVVLADGSFGGREHVFGRQDTRHAHTSRSRHKPNHTVGGS